MKNEKRPNILTLREFVEMYKELDQSTPAHWFHLVLTVLTCGIWAPIWCMYSAVCCYTRNQIRRAYSYPLELNTAGIFCTLLAAALIGVIIGLFVIFGGGYV